MSENIMKSTVKSTKKIKYSVNQKLFLLYMLNLVDWICTETLLKSGFFKEANPVMIPVFNSFWSSVLIKGVLPLIVILGCSFVYKWSGIKDSLYINILLYIGIIAYVMVNLWHILNFLLLFLVF